METKMSKKNDKNNEKIQSYKLIDIGTDRLFEIEGVRYIAKPDFAKKHNVNAKRLSDDSLKNKRIIFFSSFPNDISSQLKRELSLHINTSKVTFYLPTELPNVPKKRKRVEDVGQALDDDEEHSTTGSVSSPTPIDFMSFKDGNNLLMHDEANLTASQHLYHLLSTASKPQDVFQPLDQWSPKMEIIWERFREKFGTTQVALQKFCSIAAPLETAKERLESLFECKWFNGAGLDRELIQKGLEKKVNSFCLDWSRDFVDPNKSTIYPQFTLLVSLEPTQANPKIGICWNPDSEPPCFKITSTVVPVLTLEALQESIQGVFIGSQPYLLNTKPIDIKGFLYSMADQYVDNTTTTSTTIQQQQQPPPQQTSPHHHHRPPQPMYISSNPMSINSNNQHVYTHNMNQQQSHHQQNLSTITLTQANSSLSTSPGNLNIVVGLSSSQTNLLPPGTFTGLPGVENYNFSNQNQNGW